MAQFIEKAYILGEIEFVDFHPRTSNPIAFEEMLACKRSMLKYQKSLNDEK